jgi:flagellar M-ring protein FliF
MNAETLAAPMDGFSRLPVVKQVGLLVGLALSLALGISIALWSKEPNYSVLYSRMADRDVAEVATALSGLGIKFRLDQATGSIMVPSNKLYDARLRLASQGLPKVADTGFELLEKEQSLGTSRMKELAIHQRALEGELGRSISSLQSIESARVHLAVPKQSVFVRKRTNPTASIVVNLYGGRVLNESQLAGIVHLVSASVPNLEPEHVTVVDQRGRLLTANQNEDQFGIGDKRLDFSNRIENAYVRRIQEILTPLVGTEGVRAQVVADLDFTVIEETAELYNPDTTALRSEQVSEDIRRDKGVEGVPGALTNQPPAAGTLEPQAEEGEAVTPPTSSSSRATRNFEIDRTIRHVRQVPGALRKLSIAVVVDYKEGLNEEGDPARVPLAQEELDRITTLVRDAVGYDEARGDIVNVINASFLAPEPVEALPEPPIWENPLIWDAAKIVAGLLGVLLLIFGVLRPAMKSLASTSAQQQAALAGGEGMGALPPGAPGEAGVPGMPGGEETLSLGYQEGPTQYDAKVEYARDATKEDSKQTAQIVKTWLAADE